MKGRPGVITVRKVVVDITVVVEEKTVSKETNQLGKFPKFSLKKTLNANRSNTES